MKLIVLNSNSAGNAYVLENDSEALLIECGVRFDRIKQALRFNLKKVAGCVLTHEHKDHSKSVYEVMAAGINVYASEGTHQELGTASKHRARIMQPLLVYQVGSFRIRPFPVMHDCAQPFGFLIHHEETGWILFLTDSYFSEYKFENLSQVIIEANYCQKILTAKMADGVSPKFLRDRVIESHMSLQTCIEALNVTDLSRVQNIVLIHLSDAHSDEQNFLKEVRQATGKTVHIARAGLVIDPFSKQPF